MALDQKKLEELKAKLCDKESSLVVGDYFNDNTHSTFAQKAIRELKFAPRIAQKLVFPLIMAFPFDPLLGKETETYNIQRKYTVMVSPSNMISLIKSECEANADLKKFFMKQAQFRGEWDTSDPSVVDSAEDITILWRYRRRMTYAFPAIKISSQSVSGDKFPTTYLLNTKQDPITGEFIGDLSFMHKVGALIGSLCRREIASFNEGIESKNVNTISRQVGRSFAVPADYLSKIPNTDCQEAKDRRSEIRKCYPMTAPQPLLTTVGLAFDVTPITGTVVQQTGAKTFELYDWFRDDIEYRKHVFYTANFSAIDVIDGVIGNYYPKDPKKLAERNAEVDLYADFCILDFITEDKRDKLTNEEKMTVARDMKFITEKKPLYDATKGEWAFKGLDEFVARLGLFQEYMAAEDYATVIRNLLLQSYKTISTSMEDAASAELHSKFPLSSPLYDDVVKVMFSDVLRDIFPESMAEDSIRLGDKIEDEGEKLVNELMEAEQAKSVDGVIDESNEAFEGEDGENYFPADDDEETGEGEIPADKI